MSGLKSFSSTLTVVMLLIFATMVAIASGYRPGARFMPYIVGLPAIGFCLIQLFLDWRKNRIEPLRAGQPKSQTHQTMQAVVEEAEEDETPLVRRELLIWGYFLGFVALILTLGFYVATPLLVLTFLRFEGERSWPTAAIAAVITTGLLYVAFAMVLRLSLYAGHYGPALLRSAGL
jgi:hypothetical protein